MVTSRLQTSKRERGLSLEVALAAARVAKSVELKRVGRQGAARGARSIVFVVLVEVEVGVARKTAEDSER